MGSCRAATRPRPFCSGHILLFTVAANLCHVIFGASTLFLESVYTPCGLDGNYSTMGFQGPLTKTSHGVSGLVTVYDNCHLAVTGMKWAGTGGGITLWGGLLNQDPSELGFPLNPAFTALGSGWRGDRMIIAQLSISLTWDNVQVIYIWCDTCNKGAGASFGQVVLQDAPRGQISSKPVAAVRDLAAQVAKARGILSISPPIGYSPPSAPVAAPSANGTSGFKNCLQAAANKLNIYWSLVNISGVSYMEWGLEARLGDNSWVGFGISRNQTYYEMKYADVTVAGVMAGRKAKGFAIDYSITALQACEEVAGGYVGVCQDSILAGSPSANNVALMSAERRGDVTFVKYRKPVRTPDGQFDIDLTARPGLKGSWWVIFATGPLAPNSTNQSPLLLTHNADQGYLFGGTRIALAPPAPINTCKALLGTPAVYHPPLAPYVAAPPLAPGATRRPPPPALPQLTQCATTFNGQSYKFKACDVLPGGFIIMWSLQGLTLRAAFIAEVSGRAGWAAVGTSRTGAVDGANVLAASPAGNTVTVTQYWSLVNISGVSYMEWGLEARLGDNSWVGFGISRNQTYYEMKYADVTVAGVMAGRKAKGFAIDYSITALQACEEVAGGYVGVCQDSILAGSPSANNVALMSAERRGDVTFVKYRKPVRTPDGQFDIDLTARPGLKGSWWVIFATGPLAPNSTNQSPLLLTHNADQGYLFGGTRIALAPPAPINTCKALLGTPAVYHPPLAPYVAAPPLAPGATRRPPPPALPQLTQCATTFNGQSYKFKACDVLPGGFIIMWSLQGLTLRAAFIAEVSGRAGWAAVGTSRTGAVDGANVLAASPAGNTVTVTQYSLSQGGGSGNATGGAAAAPAGAVRATVGGNLTVSAAAGQVQSRVLTILFTLVLASDEDALATYLVWTKGAIANATAQTLSQDGLSSVYSSAISFQRGSESASDTTHFGTWGAHGALSAIAWGVVMPCGALVGRYVRSMSPYWFPVHQALQLLGYALALAGFSIGLTMEHRGGHSAHTSVGIVLFLVLAVIWRPHEDHKLRPYWVRYHLVLAAHTLLLAVVQIFLGLHVAGAARGFRIAYIVWLVLLVLTVAALECRKRMPWLRSRWDEGLLRKRSKGSKGESGEVMRDVEKDGADGGGGGGGGGEKEEAAKEKKERVVHGEGGRREAAQQQLPATAIWAREQLKVEEERLKERREQEKRDKEKERERERARAGDGRGGGAAAAAAAVAAAADGGREQAREKARTSLKITPPKLSLVERIMSPRVDSGGGSGAGGEHKDGGAGAGALYLSINTANKITDKRSGELDGGAAMAGGGVEGDLPPKPPSPRPPTRGGAAAAGGAVSPRLSRSFSGLLNKGQDAIRKLVVPAAAGGGRQREREREPAIRVDKYNVKATVTTTPDFLKTYQREKVREREREKERERERERERQGGGSGGAAGPAANGSGGGGESISPTAAGATQLTGGGGGFTAAPGLPKTKIVVEKGAAGMLGPVGSSMAEAPGTLPSDSALGSGGAHAHGTNKGWPPVSSPSSAAAAPGQQPMQLVAPVPTLPRRADPFPFHKGSGSIARSSSLPSPAADGPSNFPHIPRTPSPPTLSSPPPGLSLPPRPPSWDSSGLISPAKVPSLPPPPQSPSSRAVLSPRLL
eukprot:jgi/Mesen1/9864/ME000070S09151